jgi:hypothetical protein
MLSRFFSNLGPRLQLMLQALRPLGSHIALFAVFMVVYLGSGMKMKDTDMYIRDDVFFRADTERALKDLMGERTQAHVHTSGHPNFIIFHQPIGYVLREIIKAEIKGTKLIDRRRLASVLVTATAGAAAATLFYSLLLALGLPKLRAAIFTSVLGFSTSHLFFASTPETYIFSALGLIWVSLLAVRNGGSSAWWQLACVYACSNLTTNIALVGIWTLVRYRNEPSLKKWLFAVTISLVVTGLLMVALSCVQLFFYPQTLLFFIPSAVGRESGWLYWEHLQQPMLHTRVLLQHMGLSNIISPEPAATKPFGLAMASIESGTWEHFAPALPLHSFWLGVLLAGLAGLGRKVTQQPAVLAGIALLAFNFVFFFIFGHDRMLYCALWTANTVMIVAVGWESLIARLPKFNQALTAVLVLLVASQAWHNWAFLDKIMALVQ